MLPAEILKWENVFYPFPNKTEMESRRNLETCEMFICGENNYITNSFCKNMLIMATNKSMFWIAFLMIFSSYYQCIFFSRMMYGQTHRQIMHIIMRIFIHSALFESKFMLPVCRQNFFQVTRITWKVEYVSPKKWGSSLARRILVY